MKLKFTFTFICGLSLGLGCLACRGPERTAAPAPPRDGGDAQRLAALLDYVGGDYGLAVKDGVVLNQAEYTEQLRFLGDARRIAASLLGPRAPRDDSLFRLIDQLEARVKARGDAWGVAEACRIGREEVVLRFHLSTMPNERPSLARAEALFKQACATCHGERGDANTERAKELTPKPASFRSPARLEQLSPYRVYNALTFGVSGTAMASFAEALSPTERWTLAFFVFRLGHTGEPARQASLSLADLAARSDREILDSLKAESQPVPAAALVYLRREAAFREETLDAGIDRTRRLVRQALATAKARGGTAADRLVLDAYLQGFEPLEARLKARDPGAIAAVEAAFHDLRGALTQGRMDEARARAQALDAQLGRLANGGDRVVVPFAAAALIFFREGLEAALLVGALLAGLRRLGRPEARRFIHAGWLAALPAGLLTYWVLDRAIALGANQRELVEAVVALVAAAVLFSVSFWMISKAESRQWMDYLKKNLEQTVSRRSLFVLSGLAFLAAYREAAETVLFTQALLLESGGEAAQVWAGATTGLAGVALAAVLMNRTILRLPLGPFFAVSSLLLCGLAISFAGSGMYVLVNAGYLRPRPVTFPEVPWMGIHPDLAGLAVQFTIVAVIVTAGITTLRGRPAEAGRGR